MIPNTPDSGDDLMEWKHTATRDPVLTAGDPMLSTYEFMNVRTGEVRIAVAYDLDGAEQRIADES